MHVHQSMPKRIPTNMIKDFKEYDRGILGKKHLIMMKNTWQTITKFSFQNVTDI